MERVGHEEPAGGNGGRCSVAVINYAGSDEGRVRNDGDGEEMDGGRERERD